MRVVLIAGQGQLALEAAKSLKGRGDDVVVVTFSEQSSLDFSQYSDKIVTYGLGQVGKILKFIKESGADALLFAGKINKSLLEQNLKLDLKALWMLARLKDRQEDTIMHAIVAEIEKLNIKILSQLEVLSHLVINTGVYSKRKPNKKEMEDVKFAYKKARGVAGLDIGQVIVAKNKTVLGVESIEGTNRTIERAKDFCNGGFTVVKVAKPMQDHRFDLPVIGLETLETFAQHGGGVFAVEGGFALVLDWDACIELANSKKFVFMAYTE